MRRHKNGKKIYSIKEATSRFLNLLNLSKKRDILIQSESGALVFLVSFPQTTNR